MFQRTFLYLYHMYVRYILQLAKINNSPKPRVFRLNYAEEGMSHTQTRLVGYYSNVFIQVINTAQV